MIDYTLLCNELRRDEGVEKKPYFDSVGKLTIGVGRNLEDNGLSDDEINLLLNNDIARTIKELMDSFDWFNALSPARKRAIVNMAFNLGISRFKKFKKMIRALSIGHYNRASIEALDSRWSKQVGLRSERIANMIEEG